MDVIQLTTLLLYILQGDKVDYIYLVADLHPSILFIFILGYLQFDGLQEVD